MTYGYYFSTFGGNLVSTAAGLAVLNVIEKDQLQQNAFVVGSYLKERLNSLMEKHESELLFSFHFWFVAWESSWILISNIVFLSVIGDVRGKGMLLAVELVKDRQLKTPAKVEMLQILEQMKGLFLLLLSCAPILFKCCDAHK